MNLSFYGILCHTAWNTDFEKNWNYRYAIYDLKWLYLKRIQF